jgi:hypothetical protein
MNDPNYDAPLLILEDYIPRQNNTTLQPIIIVKHLILIVRISGAITNWG